MGCRGRHCSGPRPGPGVEGEHPVELGADGQRAVDHDRRGLDAELGVMTGVARGSITWGNRRPISPSAGSVATGGADLRREVPGPDGPCDLQAGHVPAFMAAKGE